jgi:5-methylcytosine-specific restriction protein A
MPLRAPVHRPVGWRDKAGRDRDYATHRDQASVALLNSVAWRKERRAFLRQFPRCRQCGEPSTVVDHVTPHEGDPARFFDPTGWQPLCIPCHAIKTATHDGGFGNPKH